MPDGGSELARASHAMYIDGRWESEAGRDCQDVFDPSTGTAFASVPLARPDDLENALDAAARAGRAWRDSDPGHRSAILRGAARILREREAAIARIAVREQGKVLAEARAEVEMSAALFDFYAEEVGRLYGRTLVRPTGQRSMVVTEPVGPVAAFSPWNFPIANPARKFAAPIAAGCSVILKPAEETPGSAMEVMKALIDAGLPDGVAQLVFGIPDMVSRQLLASPIIRKLSFTGSPSVGRHLMSLAAQRHLRTTMELGGHAPVIIFNDADIDRAVALLSASKFRNAGQVCIAPTRFYVQSEIHPLFVQRFTERAIALRVGDGLADGVGMGPMANTRRIAAVEGLVADAIGQGAEMALGGPIDGPGYFWKPTLLLDAPVDSRIMNEEPFGPIAIINPFDQFDEVVAEANRLPFGLAAYAFTENGRQANRIADAIEAGMLGVNTTAVGGADAPFGGVKMSGHGSENGPEGIAACRVTKAIHIA